MAAAGAGTTTAKTAREVAARMAEWDPNEQTRAETLALLESGDEAELERRFGSRLQFGTAGLRGPMGAGTSCMNDAVIAQTTQGLCNYLLETLGEEETRSRGVVIGFDHRASGSLNSRRFAAIATLAFVSRGVRVWIYPELACTPLVPWGVDERGAAAGIMVTASHNPKADDGYKVYWGNGAQIIPPHDKGIAAAIERSLEPWDGVDYAGASIEACLAHELCESAAPSIDTYIARVARECRFKELNGATAPVVYTAMHGVGYPFVQRAFEAFGLPAPIPVEAQVGPDPDFPTVAFPNPEEGKGALSLSFEAADAAGATLVLANDPDADRLAVAEKNGDEWYVFTGNEIGAILGAWLLSKTKEEDARTGTSSPITLLATTVSSKFLRAVAAAEGVQFEDTLTGFKWLGNRSQDIRDAGGRVIFAMEEAIGFCVSDVVKDKDGVCAAAVFAEMAGELRRMGRSCVDELDRIRRQYGYFVSSNKYLIVHDSATVDAIFAGLRNEGRYLLMLGRFPVEHVRDLTGDGLDTAAADLHPSLPTSKSHMVTLSLRNGCVLTLRTSGTEPKLKYYVEHAAADPATARAECREIVEALFDHVLRPEAHGLTRPEIEVVG